MKQIHLSWLLMAAAVITACEKERVETEPTVEKTSYVYSVKATISSDAETRTDYDAAGKFSWSAGDQISVLFNDGKANRFFTLTTETSGATATFTGTIEAGYEIGALDGTEEDAKIWALYPASENHSYSEGVASFYVQPEVDFTETHFSANIPMCSLLAEEGAFTFKNIAATYKFTVKNLDPRVKKVKFQIHNQTTYALSGLWPISGNTTKYVNYDYASPGSEKSTLTYTSSVTDGQAVFYVSSRYAGQFQPVIKIFDAEHDFLLKEFTAGAAKKPESMTEVQRISLSVPTELPIAIVDGVIDEWDNVSAITTNKDRIVEWKYTSDEENIYFLYKIDKTKIEWGGSNYDWKSYIYVAFDNDNDSSSGANAGAALNGGYEAQASFYPWRGTVEGSPECFKGLETHGAIENPIGNSVGNATIAGSFDNAYCYVEVSIPRNLIGSPTGDITVNHSMSWQTTGETVITLSGPAGPKPATINAEDVEVKVGKTVNIGATTNSSAAIQYESGNTNIATVTSDGTVTGVGVGSTTITLSVAEVADAFYAATKTINVTVSAPSEGIDIDGDLSDWDNIEGVSNGTYGMFKATSDADYLYFYSYRTTGGRYSEIWGASNGYIYLGFNLDGDDTNDVSLNGNGPYDFIGYFFPYGGSSDAPTIIEAPKGTCSPEGNSLSNIKCKGIINENGAFIEYRIPRTDLPTIPNESITITSWGNKDLSKVTLTCTL